MSRSVGAHQAQEQLRRELRGDLLEFLNADVAIAGYIVAWLERNLRVDQLETLVDEMDGVFRKNGQSLLAGRRGRPPKPPAGG